jgi:ArsR family transcriptional regulator
MFISPTVSPVLGTTDIDAMVAALRAAGEPTRLRVLALLSHGELSVGELAQALGQSQPRVSRHLRLMTEAGLIERAPEGAWVFYRLARRGEAGSALAEAVCAMLSPNDPARLRDDERLAEIYAARENAAASYFAANAADWERVRSLHLPDADIESAVLAAAGAGPFELMVDVGVGAGRMIEIFAGRVVRAEGFDTSRQMLSMARAALDGLGQRAVLRFGDVYDPPFEPDRADLATIHQVLHFLADPARAIAETVRLLKPGGRLLIVDFAPHDLEFLREKHAHRRLGFADAEIEAWCKAAGARVTDVNTLAPREKAALSVKIWSADRLPLKEKTHKENLGPESVPQESAKKELAV